MKKKLEKYINRKFLLYPKTRDILEVRDELYSIVLDRYNDCLNWEWTKKQAINGHRDNGGL